MSVPATTRLAGLSAEKYREYQFSSILAEIVEADKKLSTSNVGTGNPSLDVGDDFGSYVSCVEHVLSFTAEPASVSFEELTIKSGATAAVIRLLSATENDERCRDSCGHAVQVCRKLLASINDFTVSAAGPVGIARMFDEFLGILETISRRTLILLQRTVNLTVNGSLLEDVCAALCVIVNSYSNRKKLFQLFVSKVLPLLITLLDSSSRLPTSVVQGLHALLEKGLFSDEKDIEEISNVALFPGESSLKAHKQSYFVGFFEAIQKFCLNNDIAEFDNCTVQADGLAAVLSVYGSVSTKIYNNQAEATSHEKQIGGGSQLWRKHCFRVLHVAFQLFEILERHFVVSSLSCSDQRQLWLLKSKTSILSQVHNLLPGSLPQHKTLDPFVLKLKEMAHRSLRLLCVDDTDVKSSESGTDLSTSTAKRSKVARDRPVSKAENDGINPIYLNCNVEELTKRLCWVRVMATVSELEMLKVMMMIDHRAVLECLEEQDGMVLTDDIVTADQESKEWAAEGTKLLVKCIVECPSDHTCLSRSVTRHFPDSVTSVYHALVAESAHCLHETRLQLLRLLVDIFSDLRRVDVLVHAMLTSFHTEASLWSSGSLGSLLSHSTIQTRLSRVIMSLSSAQLVNLWTKLSLGDGRVHEPHNCSLPLIRATVRAMLSSPEINIASVSLQSVARILAQVG
jgi:hypothetical protein